MERATVPCTIGGQVVVTGSQSSTTKVMRSYPNCTVTVYVSGTLTLASLFSNNGVTPQANPFSANAQGFGAFYAANGVYDIQISGAGLGSPYTFGAVSLFDVLDYSPSANGPNLSVQYKYNGLLTGDANISWNPATQAMGIAGIANTPALFVATGQIVSANDSYQGYTTSTDGIVSRGQLILQNAGATRGGYLVIPPITYNPYDGAPCFDQWGNPVNQPLPLPGYSFGTFDAVIWNSPSPSMPANGSCGAPLPVNPTYMGIQAGTGLNTNAYFLARGGLATDNNAFNSIQSLLGGAYVRLGYATDQAIYLERHDSSAQLNTPSSLCVYSTDPGPPPGCYGSLAYKDGSVFYYWNNATLDWHEVDFSQSGGGGGGGSNCGAPTSAVLIATATGCTGSGNILGDGSGNLSLGGTSGASTGTLAINGPGPNAGLNITAQTSGASIQSVGGINLNLGAAATVGVTIKQASAATADFLDMKDNGGTKLAYFGNLGTLFAPGASLGSGGLILGNVTGMAQCLQVNTSGVVSGSGGTCGAGGGGAPGSPSTSVQTNQGGVFTGNAGWEATFSGSVATVTLTGSNTFIADAATTVPVVVKGAGSQSANLLNIENSSATVLANFGSLGTLFGPGASFTITNAATQGIIVKGAVAQSANLQEWQNSSATVLANIGSSGTFFGPGASLGAGGLTMSTLAGSGTQCLQANNSGVVSGTGSACGSGGGGGAVGPTGAIQYSDGTGNFQGSANAVTDANGNISIAGTGSVLAIAGTNGGITISGSNGQINSTVNTNRAAIQTVGGFTSVLGANTVGLTIKGNGSQSANLAEFQNSSGTVLANVGSLGTWFGPGAAFTITNLATVGLIVKGATGQTAHFLDIEDSTSNVLTYVDTRGVISSSFIGTSASSALNFYTAGGTWTVNGNGDMAITDATTLPGGSIVTIKSTGSGPSNAEYIKFLNAAGNRTATIWSAGGSGYMYLKDGTNTGGIDSAGAQIELKAFTQASGVGGQITATGHTTGEGAFNTYVPGSGLFAGHTQTFSVSNGTGLCSLTFVGGVFIQTTC